MNDQILLKSQISFPQPSSDFSPIILEEIRALKREVQTKALDQWLDAKQAAKYMNISASSFDKYRYKTRPRLKGYNLDGKTLYKVSEIDLFIRLYEAKASLAD